ncbi:MAG: hypothetical protein PWP56_1809 [Acetobacterium sp.]|jgi:methanogenic corrinoid protein MtbC1|nr:hypothetical protein [Acetobacterium sp.]
MLNLRNMTQAIGDLEEEKIMDLLQIFVATSPSELELQEAVVACQEGMMIVGNRFEKGEYFVGDLIFAGKLLTETIEVLKTVLIGNGEKIMGTIILGTVRADLHDIGKNIFKSMAEGAGFKVIDLGIDVAPCIFVEKSKEYKPSIVGLSGVLTMAIDSMKETVDALKVAGIDAKIIIGGNPVTKEVSKFVGADGYTTNAAEGVKICQDWMLADVKQSS